MSDDTLKPYYLYGVEVLETRDHKNPRKHICEYACDRTDIGINAIKRGGKDLRRFKILVKPVMQGGVIVRWAGKEEDDEGGES